MKSPARNPPTAMKYPRDGAEIVAVANSPKPAIIQITYCWKRDTVEPFGNI